jgi:hypothetical protein
MTLEELAEQIQAVQKALEMDDRGLIAMKHWEREKFELDLANLRNQEQQLLRDLQALEESV